MAAPPPDNAAPGTLPEVALDVRHGPGRLVPYALTGIDFLIGTVPGCDLRVPGTDLPPVLCVLARYPGGVCLRKLAPTQVLLHNGRTATNTDLDDGDRLTIGAVDLVVRIKSPPAIPAPAVPDVEQAQQELEQQAAQLRGQLERFQEEREAFDRRRRQEHEALETKHRLFEQERAAWFAERETPVAEPVRADELTALRQRLEEERAAFAERQTVSEGNVARERAALEAKVREYQADVLRLDRRLGNLEEREKDVERRTAEVDAKWAALQQRSAELEAQVVEIDDWREQLTRDREAFDRQKQEHDARAAELANRTASIEGQQATLAALRSRLERTRDDLREQDQQLDAQRSQQQEAETAVARERQALQQLRLDLDAERHAHAQERQQWAQRGAIMEAAVRQLREAQDRLTAEERRIGTQTQTLDERAAALAGQEGVLQGRLAQLAEVQERLETERNALRERSAALVQKEQAREALQEQLRRRSDELTAWQKTLNDQMRDHQTRAASLEERQADFARREEEHRQQTDATARELDDRRQTLEAWHAELTNIEAKYQGQLDQLTALRQALAEDRLTFQKEREAALEQQAGQRTAFEALRREAQELVAALPEAELRVTTALDRLGHARKQLRDHLAEIHQYVRVSQEDLEGWRSRLQADVDKLQDQEQSLRRKQDEHRLTMAEFRQQLIDWQGQIADMKRLLARDETRLERRQAQVEAKVRQIDATSERLAKQAEELEEQQREVADRRQEMDRHLVDMREWYRGKLRDLAGIPTVPMATDADPTILPTGQPDDPPVVGEDGEPALVPTTRSILALGPADPGDQRLGDVLRELHLIDADTLTALLAEARRQRRSLRQVLLASGAITLYQLALIEAGNVDGLMLRPVRVIDRLRASPHEAVYRVFDPRRGQEAVLRHLTEDVMLDAVRPDEYRQRFGQAILGHPHVANALEVLEIHARPAVLQEWLTGLPATDWPPLAAAPGVCYRLLTQAAQGLSAAHAVGLVHGHLTDGHLLLTPDGTLKLCGLGEPPWLHGNGDDEATTRDDLKALGRIVSGWCTPTGVRRGAKTKPLPDALVSVLYRLAADGDAGYRAVDELRHDLEAAAGDIPPNAEAWDRLLKYVRDHGSPDAVLRQSA